MTDTVLDMSGPDRVLVALILRAFPFSAPPPMPQTQAAQWDALVERARYHGLIPLLCAALDAQPNDTLPAAMPEMLQDTYRGSVLANAKKYYELDTLLDLTRAANLPLVMLKDAALAKWLYPDPGLRPFGDADVLLHQNDVPRLQTLLQARGDRASGELAAGFRDAYYSEMAFTQSVPPHLALDVHWHLFVPVYFRARMDSRWFWTHTQPYAQGGTRLTLLNPTAQLVHLAVHASLNHRHTPRLLWLYDLALLQHKHAAEIDWDDAAAFVRASQVTRSVREILEQTAQWWGVRAPASFLQTLQNTRIGVDERIAFALTAADRNEARVLSDALATPGISNKLRYALRHVFPDAAYMREHYHVRHSALLPFYYVRRTAETSWKFLRSVASAITPKT